MNSERSTMNGKPVYRVPVKTVLNLDSGFREKLLCDGPALSLGDGCAYSCAFCYVPSVYQKMERVREVLGRTGLRHDEVVMLRENALEVLKGQLLHPNGKPRFADPSDRRVVYSSPADDVAANMDLVRATVEACKLILGNTNWQIRLLSKSTLLPRLASMLIDEVSNDVPWPVTSDEIRSRMIFGVSTGTPDDGLASAIEEGTPLVSKRIASLRMLQDNGFRTYAMVCPSLPHRTGWDYRVFAERMRELLRYERCEHVWAEVINLRGESFKRTRDALVAHGYDEEAHELGLVSTDDALWEAYNRATFLAHASACEGLVGKLRFLTYVKPSTRAFWEREIHRGAVLLGKGATT